MQKLRRVCFIAGIAFALSCASLTLSAVAAPSVQVRNHASSVAVTLYEIYQRAYDESYSRHAIMQDDGTTFVSTGDIDMEWLRDSSATMDAFA